MEEIVIVRLRSLRSVFFSLVGARTERHYIFILTTYPSQNGFAFYSIQLNKPLLTDSAYPILLLDTQDEWDKNTESREPGVSKVLK